MSTLSRKWISWSLAVFISLLWLAACSNEEKKEARWDPPVPYVEPKITIYPVERDPLKIYPYDSYNRTGSENSPTIVRAFPSPESAGTITSPESELVAVAKPKPRTVTIPDRRIVAAAKNAPAAKNDSGTNVIPEEKSAPIAQVVPSTKAIAVEKTAADNSVQYAKQDAGETAGKRGQINYQRLREMLIAAIGEEDMKRAAKTANPPKMIAQAAEPPAANPPAAGKKIPKGGPIESVPVSDKPAAGETPAAAGGQAAPATTEPPVLNKPTQVTEPAAPKTEPAAPSGEAGTAAAPAGTGKDGEILITNSFFETDIRQALNDVGLAMGQTIIVSPDVQGYISLELKDIPLEKALRLMLAGTGYIFKKMPDYYLVCSTDPDSKTFLDISETKIVNLNYVSAEDAVKMLPTSLQKYVRASTQQESRISRRESESSSYGGGRSIGSSRVRAPEISGSTLGMGNMVSITAPPEILERVVEELKLLDRRPQQILLDARIVVLETQDLLELGVDWTWPSISAGAMGDNTMNGTWPWGVRMGYSPSKEFTDELIMSLNLLTQNDEATVIANPQVLAQDGKPAQISVTNEEYFEILTRGYYTQSELEKVEVGTILTITPRIGEGDEINMEMSTEVSDVVSRGSNNLPVVTRRSTINTVRVEDGGTAAVAGLVDTRTRLQNKKVPFIGSIPVLGEPFKNQNNSGTSRQVAVFVTPRIIGNGHGAYDKTPYKKDVFKPVGDEFKTEIENKLKPVSQTPPSKNPPSQQAVWQRNK